MTTKKVISVDGEQIPISSTKDGAVYELASEDQTFTIEVLSIEGDDAVLRINGKRVVVPFVGTERAVEFLYEGERYLVEVSDAAEGRRRHTKELSMAAPMPGVVSKIFVAVGDVVSKGAPLLVLEAMKMEHQISANYDGTVRALHCAVGDLVQPGAELISIEPDAKP